MIPSYFVNVQCTLSLNTDYGNKNIQLLKKVLSLYFEEKNKEKI